MVNSIKYWMRAFGLLKAEGELTSLAHKLMSNENGYDPFFEDTGSLWLLHFNLINEDYATVYKSTFIDYHKQRNLIDGIKLQNFIKHLCFDGTSYKNLYNENTVKRDIGVLFHNYCTLCATVCFGVTPLHGLVYLIDKFLGRDILRTSQFVDNDC